MVIMAACTLSIFNSSLYIYIYIFTLPKKSAKVVCKGPDMFAENHGKRRATQHLMLLWAAMMALRQVS